jgi:hypothetical protein
MTPGHQGWLLLAMREVPDEADALYMTNSDSQNVTLIQATYDAFARGDVDLVVAAMHDDVVWHEAEHSLWHKPGGYHGPADVLSNVFGRIAEQFRDFRVIPQGFHDAGNTVIVEGRYQATTINGDQLDAQVCHIWMIRDGKIGRFHQYTDTLQLAEAAGP